MSRTVPTLIDLAVLAIAGAVLWSDAIGRLLPGNLLAILATIAIFASLWRLWHRYRAAP